jgi:hypothetical protein
MIVTVTGKLLLVVEDAHVFATIETNVTSTCVILLMVHAACKLGILKALCVQPFTIG